RAVVALPLLRHDAPLARGARRAGRRIPGRSATIRCRSAAVRYRARERGYPTVGSSHQPPALQARTARPTGRVTVPTGRAGTALWAGIALTVAAVAYLMLALGL